MGNDFRVLIIEDDVRTVRFIGAKLRAAGYVVEAVGNGNEAVDRLRSTDPDLVLLDLLLPGKNGLQVLSELRSFSKVPVIVLTAEGALETRERVLALGADDFVPKPFNPAVLVEKIEAIRARKPTDR